jgi:hypothetical protein
MMLQFAFGSETGSARPASGPVTHANGVGACETAAQMLALAAAARSWWEARRPEGWSLEQHLADPAAGCSASAQERALAATVAHWIRQGG